MSVKKTVQDFLQEKLLEQSSEENDMLQLLEFMKNEGVPLTPQQAAAAYILQENGLPELSNYIMNVRKEMTPTKKFFEVLNKITLADRIKGNAKLSGLLKAQVPGGGIPSVNMNMNPERAGR